jgi:ferric-dicitrate binding protein FerR (iron transport regulator)
MANPNIDRNAVETASLILRHLQNKLTREEKHELDKWLSEDEANPLFLESLEGDAALDKHLEFFSSIQVDSDLQKVRQRLSQKRHKTYRWMRPGYLEYAAMVAVVFSIGIWGYNYFNAGKKTMVTTLAKSQRAKVYDVPPGDDGAKLELADGSVIYLGDKQQDSTILVNGVKINQKDGVIYDIRNLNATNEVRYNRISTAKGGQYQIILPDGTRVWLNSESSLRFPTAFTGKERNVELSGEGYFEVAKSIGRSFKVQVEEVSVEVLGTHFNIMSYPDEKSINTTLLEGSVKVRKGATYKLIIPGQQAQINEGIKLADVDVNQAVAWKHGFFEFNSTELPSIVRQLERWYDVEIEVDKKVAVKHFSGTISRDTPISQVLKMLKLTGGLDFKIEERRVYLFE